MAGKFVFFHFLAINLPASGLRQIRTLLERTSWTSLASVGSIVAN